MDRGDRRTRRRALGVAAGAALGMAGAAALGGCGLFDADPEPVPAPEPLQPVLDGAVTLAAAYERAIATQPGLARRLTPLVEAHRAHAAELNRVIGTPAATSPSTPAPSEAPSTDPPATLGALRTAEQRAQRTAATVGRRASADRAALVGSIAAARASHVEALR